MLYYYKKVLLAGKNLHSICSIVTEDIGYFHPPVKIGGIEIGIIKKLLGK
jgi:hypothetical protein